MESVAADYKTTGRLIQKCRPLLSFQ